MSSPIALTSATIASNAATEAAHSAATANAASTATLANQNVFLQLLVAQLKNQDPSNPTDGTAFVTQLAQFSELSNTTQMAGSLQTITTDIQGVLAPAAATTPPAGTTTSSGTPPTSL
jgi:flagellar basal-body rod modification protein FlgD